VIHHYLINECGASPAEVALYLKDCDILPIMDGDVKVGEVMMSGSEIHVAFSRTYRGNGLFKKRAKVREFFDRLLEQHKFLTTRSRKGDDTERFIRGLGFVVTNSDEHFNYWWLDRPPFERRAP
jgi:hypothetical protein